MKTIFVEDTPSHRNTIRQILGEFEQIELLGEANSVETGYDLILKVKPELVFLDIELYPGTAFDLLNQLQRNGKIEFEVIFLTGFANFEYPVRAIQHAALDFLMKPLDKNRMKAAIERAENKIAEKNKTPQYLNQIQLLLQNLTNTSDKRTNRIAFHRSFGTIEDVVVDDILYLEADKEITYVFLKDGRNFAALRNISFYDKSLKSDFDFFRIHDKRLLNLTYLRTYNHSQDYQVMLTNGKILYASRRLGQQLKEYIKSNPTNGASVLIPEADKSILRTLLKKLLG